VTFFYRKRKRRDAKVTSLDVSSLARLKYVSGNKVQGSTVMKQVCKETRIKIGKMHKEKQKRKRGKKSRGKGKEQKGKMAKKIKILLTIKE
jgi:hypothetical protein